jgi:4-hydroxybenzoate polyprenyltransferase
MARIDHWAKNVLIVPGAAVALFYAPDQFTTATAKALLVTLAAVCLIASSYYVINEYLDAGTDRFHPHKRSRAAASGTVSGFWVLVEWVLLTAGGGALAAMVGWPVAIAAGTLWLMGVLYNVPPVRLKDWPYLDVLSESANNPLRLALGWFAVIPDRLPPFSLIVAYWMGGAFLMAVKRLSEYRELSASGVAGDYRRSFRAYSERSLLASSVFYAVLGAQFSGMFMLRYRIELVLMTPLVAGLFAYYLHLCDNRLSAVQHPERLFRERGFSIYVVACLAVFILLMFVEVPVLHDWFTVEPAGVAPLWRLGS